MPEILDLIAMAEERARRLALIADGYEVSDEGMSDGSVPGAARVQYLSTTDILRKHPRYVLVTQYGDHGNYRLYLANDLANVEQLAANALTDANGGELVVCYFDLDKLDGPEPDIYEDDVEVIERAAPDERMPVRYGLAKIVVTVAFNTVPSP